MLNIGLSVLQNSLVVSSEFAGLALFAGFLTCPWIELVTASAAPLYNHRSCEAAVQEWSNKEKLALNKELKLVQPGSRKILELLFFLHIPRTGGRTYHQWYGFTSSFKLSHLLSAACLELLSLFYAKDKEKSL